MLENVFEVQDEIGRRVVESLQSRFPLTVSRSRDRYSSDPEAYNDFMAGLRESSSDRPEHLRTAAAHLSSAVARDPEFALAHATLSLVSMNMRFEFDPPRTVVAQSEDHCRRASDARTRRCRRDIWRGRAWILAEPSEKLSARGRHRRAGTECWPRDRNLSGFHNRMGHDLLAYRTTSRSAHRPRAGLARQSKAPDREPRVLLYLQWRLRALKVR